uniref:Uncharacterized protein n=1 Tax=Thuricola similis TaxID=2784598 RepID=A0A7T8JKB2_9CILI|nr:hypothetical protein K4Z05_mgp26 [Thuricola similis]QQP22137.1 hypothetical protein TSIM_26 [Thuricola similis]
MFIEFYKKYIYRPTTKFYQNLFFIKNTPSAGIEYNLSPSQLIESENSLTTKIFKEVTVIQFYSWTIIILYIITIIEFIYLIINQNVSLYI